MKRKMSEHRTRRELHCHACGMYVQFEVDLNQNGNYVFECPNCGHEHCRVVKDGEITDIRWDRRNGPTFHMTRNTTWSTTQLYSSGTTGTAYDFLRQAWFDSDSFSSTGTGYW